MIKVLVVDDSRVAREGLARLLSADPEVQVVATASNGQEALDLTGRERPDVITMDLHMPVMNGYEATRRIMETFPTPIVIVSGSSAASELVGPFRAFEAGALNVVPKPAGEGHPLHKMAADELRRAVKLMAEVKVVRRWPRGAKEKPPLSPAPEVSVGLFSQNVEAIAIGASTGGPQTLQAILSSLRRDFTIPLLIVQHMAPGFIQGFAEWLSEVSNLRVGLVCQDEPIRPGRVYLAPDGFHMGVGPGPRIVLGRTESPGEMQPSVNYLFRSMALRFGARCAGVLLTGMGKDGAEALKLMKQAGALTIAQDEASSIVHGMPGEAIKLGAATWVLSPENIAAAFNGWVQKRDK